MEDIYLLPEYELFKVNAHKPLPKDADKQHQNIWEILKQSPAPIKTFSGIRVKATTQGREVKQEEVWGDKSKERLWRKFLELETEEQMSDFANAYGVLGIAEWNPFAPPDNENDATWWQTANDLEILRAAYAVQEVCPDSRFVDGQLNQPQFKQKRDAFLKQSQLPPFCAELDRACIKNPSPFHRSLWPWWPEDFEDWRKLRDSFSAFLVLVSDLDFLQLERHGTDKTREGLKALGIKPAQAVDALKGALFTFLIQGLPQEKWPTPAELNKALSEPTNLKDLLITACQQVTLFSQQLYGRARICTRLNAGRWQLHAEPVNLIHFICLDFLEDLVHSGRGILKPCAGQSRGKPCPYFARWNSPYHADNCKWAEQKRKQRKRNGRKKANNQPLAGKARLRQKSA